MKKIFKSVLLIISMLALQTIAFADIAPLPPNYRVKEALSNYIVPIVLVIIVIAVVILVRVLKRNKK